MHIYQQYAGIYYFKCHRFRLFRAKNNTNHEDLVEYINHAHTYHYIKTDLK